jgi:Polyketide cyclase / dehydrase and lipid transport
MTRAKHTHSIHIDAPAEKVFDYIANPVNFIESMASTKAHPTVESVYTTATGQVERYTCSFSQLHLHLNADFTREEFVPDKRFADRSSKGVLFTVSVEPDDTGSTLTYTLEASRFNEWIDAVFTHGEKDTQAGLPIVKQAVEAMD